MHFADSHLKVKDMHVKKLCIDIFGEKTPKASKSVT